MNDVVQFNSPITADFSEFMDTVQDSVRYLG